MEHIRLATDSEIKGIAEGADLSPLATIVALDGTHGANIAVVRAVTEVDPIYWAPGVGIAEKARFVWGLEERLIGNGVSAYYFTIKNDDTMKEWRETVKKWGAGCIFENGNRYKKVLTR